MTVLSAMILAGGRSRRLGRDKALLTMPNGQPLLTKTVQVAQALTSEVVVITPWPERYETIVRPPAQLLLETPHQQGPLGGFSQGWEAVQTDWCLVLACDLPQLASEPLQTWWAWIQKQQRDRDSELTMPGLGSAIASLAHSAHTSSKSQTLNQGISKQWEPLCGFYHRNCLPSLHRHLKAASGAQSSSGLSTPSSLSFQAWLEPLPIMTYNDLPESVLFNCNTAEDWANFCA